MVKCPNCGIEVEGYDLCPKCATDLSNIKEPIKKVNNPNKMINYCPTCGVELDSNSAFCSSCGSKLITETNKTTPNLNNTNTNTNTNTNINEIISNIQFDKLITYTILSLVLATIISTVVLYLLAYTSSYPNIPYYPIAFYIGISISVGIFAAFTKDNIEAGILGFIVGLVLLLIENTIIGLIFNSLFAYIYNLGYSGHSIGYIIIGIIMALISQTYLKDTIRNKLT